MFRNRWIIVTLIVVAAAWVWRCRASDESRASEHEKTRRVVPRAPLYFRDGRWVRLDQRELRRVLADLASRKPGLVRVTGTVRDADTDTPIPNAEVVFASPLGESTTNADANGVYSIEVRPGLYRGFARAENHVAVGTARFERLPGEPDPGDIGMPRGELAPVLAVFRDQNGVDMHLRGGGQIIGTVYDQSGRPVAGAIVRGRLGRRLRLVLGTDLDETDLHGSFRLEVPAGYVVLDASHEQFAGVADESQNSVFVEPGGTARVDLTLMEGCIIRGRVVDGKGRPVGEGSLEQHYGGVPPNDFAPVGRIDANGEFRLARTSPGTIKLRAWPWKSPPTAPTEVSCSDGTRYEDLTFVVPDADPDLEGSVWTADGEPLGGAFVDIHPLSPGGMAQQERADAYGEWAVFSLPPGEYQVTAYAPSRGAAAMTVTVPSRGARLTLSGTGTISGRAQGMTSGSFTFEIARCLIFTKDGRVAQFDEVSMPRTRRIVSVEGGRFEIEDVPACPLQALVRRGSRAERVDIEVQRDREVELELDLREASPVTVHGVVTANGEAVSGVTIVRLPGPGAPRDRSEYAVTDEDGRYEIQAYTGDQLFFRSREGSSAADVTWDDGDVQRIDISLTSD